MTMVANTRWYIATALFSPSFPRGRIQSIPCGGAEPGPDRPMVWPAGRGVILGDVVQRLA